MELFAADGHDAGGCERVTGKSGMRPRRMPLSSGSNPMPRFVVVSQSDGGAIDSPHPTYQPKLFDALTPPTLVAARNVRMARTTPFFTNRTSFTSPSWFVLLRRTVTRIPSPSVESTTSAQRTGCLREGAKSYAKVKHVLRRRRGCCTPVQVARTFSPCSRN